MARGTPGVQFAFPTPEGWERNVLIGLFVAYVAELVVARVFPDPQALYTLLAWSTAPGVDPLSAPWQPFTRFLVQGNNAVEVLFSLVLLFFALPTLGRLVDESYILRGLIAALLMGTVLPAVVSLSGLASLPDVLMGWGQLILLPFVLIGLIQPKATLYLLVFPVEGRWLLWGSLAIPLLQILLLRSASALELLGFWLGPVLWFYLLGPGRPKRDEPAPKGPVSDMERLSRFQVIQGGASNRPDDDELVN